MSNKNLNLRIAKKRTRKDIEAVFKIASRFNPSDRWFGRLLDAKYAAMPAVDCVRIDPDHMTPEFREFFEETDDYSDEFVNSIKAAIAAPRIGPMSAEDFMATMRTRLLDNKIEK